MGHRDSERTAACDPDKAMRNAGAVESYVVRAMPKRGGDIAQWLRELTDAYMRGALESDKLNQARKTAGSLWEGERTGADVKRADAAMKAAEAQERMAEVLAVFEHGGAAVAMLARLQEGLGDGKRRALPGRAVRVLPAKGEPA